MKGYLKRSSPAILTCLGAIGVVATSVLAVKATPKAVDIIRAREGIDHEGNYYGPTKLEVVQLTWKCYIPAALVGLSTITCIFGANVLNKRNQASLASAYALLREAYQQYRKAANTVYGEDADSKISQIQESIRFQRMDIYIQLDLRKILFMIIFKDISSQCPVLNAQYY